MDKAMMPALYFGAFMSVMVFSMAVYTGQFSLTEDKPASYIAFSE